LTRVRRVFKPELGVVGSHTSIDIAERADGCAGWIDNVLSGPKGTYALIGWAADILGGTPARRVHVLMEGRWVSAADVRVSRPDVLNAYPALASDRCGFFASFRLRKCETPTDLRLFAETFDSRFFEVPLPDAILDKRNI
jgi:hypothetical protein